MAIDVGVRGSIRRAAGTLALCAVVVPGSPAGAAAREVPEAAWDQAVSAYLVGAPGAGARLVALGRSANMDGLQPSVKLVVADALFRTGSVRRAGRLLDEVLAGDSGDPWRGLAGFARGWVSLRSGKLDEARAHFDVAADDPGGTRLVGHLMVAMVDATNGDTSSATARFERLAVDPDAPAGLRHAATLGAGYARFWAGDDVGARRAFETLAETAGEGRLADVARYGGALAQWRLGDAAGARDTLLSLSGDAGAAAPRALASLDPRALVRESLRRYRLLPVGMPLDRVATMLDVDVRPLARATLDRIARGESPPQPIVGRPSYGPQITSDPRALERVAPARAEPRPSGTRARPLLLLAALSLVGAVLWQWKRRRHRSSR